MNASTWSRSLWMGMLLSVTACVNSAQAVITYNDNVTPAAIFGTGNANGSFTVDRQNGVELGLRGKVRYPVPANVFNSNGDGTYTFKAGVFNGVQNPQWHFEWSVNSNYDGSGGNLSDYTYLLEMDFDPGAGTNFLAWDQISHPTSAIPWAVPQTPPFYDHSIGTNATASGAGVEAGSEPVYAGLLAANNVAQNSWRYPFYQGAPYLFDANATGRYEIRLTAFSGMAVVSQVSIEILVEGFVTPEVVFGSGNVNGNFTLDRSNGVELGLRAKQRFPSANVFNNNFDGTYTFLAGVFNGIENPQWNFEWTVNTDYTGLTGNKVSDFTYLLEMDFDPGVGTDFLAWDQISYPTEAIPYDVPATPPFYDHSFGTNATANGAGVEALTEPAYAALLPANNVVQNSWRYTFYDGAPFLFNAAAVGRYDIRLTAFDGMTVAAQVTAQVKTVLAGTCFVDAVCEDGLACNGVETCNLTTNECEFGTEVDCSGLDDQCNVGTCVDPAGTCTAVPVSDGTLCDDGDLCSITDSCQAGACAAGGGGDSDFDGTCDADDLCPVNAPKIAPGICGCAVADTDTDSDSTADCNDNCPADANPDQADIDNDGIGNVCDNDDANGSLVVSQVRIKAANPDVGANGRVRVAAVVLDGVAGGTLADDLVLGNVYVELSAGGFSTTAAVGTCTGTGRIKCRNEATGVKASFTPLVQGDNNVPDVWKMRLSQRKVASTVTPTAPASLSLVQPTPSITRADDISACDARPARLNCREN
ncbi:MAG: hypothetical protein ABR587_06105 [Candidatus Binatia bacterium]